MEKELTGYPSIDKPWLKYYDREKVNNIKFPNTTLYKYIYQNNIGHLKDDALVYFGKHVSYREMLSDALKIAGRLYALGIRKGDFILVCMTGTPEAVELLLACSRIGACAVMLNPTLTTDQLHNIILECDSKMLFCMDALYPTIAPALQDVPLESTIIASATQSLPFVVQCANTVKMFCKKKVRIPYKDTKYQTWTQFMRGKQQSAPKIQNGELPLAIVFSSGTTGKAKGIVHINRSYTTLAIEYMTSGYPVGRGDRYYNNVPFFVATGLSYMLFVPLSLGMPVVINPIYNSKSFAKDVLKYRPAVSPATKSFWYEAMEDKKFKNADLSFLKIPTSGGEQITAWDEIKLNKFWAAHGCNQKLYTGWGMSETNATIVATRPSGNSIGASGTPMPHTVVSAFGLDTGTECKYGHVGELQVTTPCAMKEYFQNSKATKEFFRLDEQGRRWCHTGDIGYVNEAGEVFVLGRASESYRADNGKRVYMFEIENAIMSETSVDRCKAVATTEIDKTFPVAHIILKENANEQQALQRIRRICEEKLSAEAIPERYVLHKEFPITANGKLDFQALAKGEI